MRISDFLFLYFFFSCLLLSQLIKTISISSFQAAMHQAMAAAYPSSLVPNSVPGHGGYSPGSGLPSGHGGRSPVSSPTPQPPPSMATPGAHMGPGSGYPASGVSGAHNTSGNDGGMSSDCSDDEGSPGGPGGAGNIIIHPWMKKIHVAGAGNVTSHFPVCLCPYFHGCLSSQTSLDFT